MAFLKSIGVQSSQNNIVVEAGAVGNCASPVAIVVAPNCLALFWVAFFWPVQMVVRAMGEAIGNRYNLLDKVSPNRPAATKHICNLKWEIITTNRPTPTNKPRNDNTLSLAHALLLMIFVSPVYAIYHCPCLLPIPKITTMLRSC